MNTKSEPHRGADRIEPLDEKTLQKAVQEARGLVGVEDHAINGGLGDAVAAAVGGMAPVHRLGIAEMPRSGKKDELLEHYGISRHAIEERVLSLAA
jgi:transketolase